MPGIERRIERLEGLIPPTEDEGEALREAVRRDVINEFGRLHAKRVAGLTRHDVRAAPEGGR